MQKPKTFYDLFAYAAEQKPALETFKIRKKSGVIQGRTFKRIHELVTELAAGLKSAGVAADDRVTLLCDSSPNWILADAAIVAAGAVCVPRGTDVTDDDILYIVGHSESRWAIVQKAKDRDRLLKFQKELPALEKIWVLEDDDSELAAGESSAEELLALGKTALHKDSALVIKLNASADPAKMATIIYTSGTTGAPKGVMLNQTGWLNALGRALEMKVITEKDTALSLLPPWHAFERAVEYGVMMAQCEFMISGINTLRQDLGDFKPTSFPSVPRIWESLYNGIMQKLEKESPVKRNVFYFFLDVGAAWAKHEAIFNGYDLQVKPKPALQQVLDRAASGAVLAALLPLKLASQAVFAPIHQALGGNVSKSASGGSALPQVVDRFLTAIGIKVLEGYGMTETSALISLRDVQKPVSGTVGRPFPGYKIKLKNDLGAEVPLAPGAKGTLWVHSNQLLLGYYKRPELNAVIFDKDGFFDTGDIMVLTAAGDLMFAGRSKETIALAGGENIEPVPIEDKLLASEFIDQVMIVGDDRKTLGAIIVPNFEKVRSHAGIKGIPESQWNDNAQVREIFKNEISQRISAKTGFKSFEQIPKNLFYLVPRQFEIGQELTRTYKLRRTVIKDMYKNEIDSMYS
ncbi:AMP-dependent synthetase/ligase [Turneriella parva]|uniref:AMP-dependent synthetase and ligase n=1 Tax=Turneriella parva (strain ATCC BAA-1111 / DSM 21527 / NCTC 11395 / H) TaxID=869212 RepID=I4BBJ3_TURPD|nr:AMP-binding protein [Turneriella parva]AFM14650.1 AMP-dependent synthetase and ligase [Turneriella parva DSM 21527]